MMPNSVHLRRPTVVDPIPMLLLLLLVTVRSSSAQPSSSNNNGNNNPPYNGLTNFNPSMAIVIVVLISAFFFLGFFSIYIRQCGGAAIRGDAAAVAAGGRSRRGNAQRGLDPEILETFPTLVYSEVKGLKIGKGSLECAVCLSEFEDDETLRLLPKCSHAFHPDCIDAWLAAHVTCPVCRTNLVPDPSSPSDPALPTADTEAAEADPIVPPDHVAISVEQEEDEAPNRGDELADLARIGSERRAAALRAKSVARPPRFPRSHSTGHSVLARPGENLDRFTLRLPEHVKREIVDSAAASRLQRTKSCVNFPSTEMSTRRGYRSGAAIGEGSGRAGRSVRLGRSDRWPSFLARTLSARFTSRGNGKRGDGEGSTKKGETDGSVKGRLPSVRVPFECLGGGVRPDGDYDSTESQTVPINRV